MVKVDVGSQASQSSSIGNVVSSRTSALRQATTALTNFMGATGLEGAAYTNAKAYASNVLIPLVQALTLYSESVRQNTADLVSQYTSYFGSESLDSERLEEEIRLKELSLNAALKTYYLLLKEGNGYNLSDLSEYIDSLRGQIAELREKLRKLHHFNALSAHTFEDSAILEAALMAGLSQVEGDFSSFSSSQSFPTYNKQNLSWVKTVSTAMEKRDEIIHSYNAVMDRYESGQDLSKEDIHVLSIYKNYFPHASLPEDLLKKIESSGEDDNFFSSYVVPSTIGEVTGSGTEKLYSSTVGQAIEEKFVDEGVQSVLKNTEYVFNNRYSTTNSAGKIIGMIPGETKRTIVKENGEILTKSISKANFTNSLLGEAVSFGPGVLVGVGIDMMSGDSAEEAWGKEITTGAVSTVVTPIAVAGVEAFAVATGFIAAGASLPVFGVAIVGIGVAAGVAWANDYLTSKFPELEEFEDNIGEGVVNSFNSIKDTIGGWFH